MNEIDNFFHKLNINTDKKVKKEKIDFKKNCCFDYTYDENTNLPIEERFQLKFTPCVRETGSWKEEIFATVKDIKDSAKKPIYVLYSGGLDSEVVCEAMKQQNINFKAVSLLFTDISNYNDIEYAIEYCSKNKIEHIIKKIKIQDFVDYGIPFYQKLGLRATTIYRYLQCFYIDLIESLDGHGVICGGIESVVHLPENIKKQKYIIGMKFSPEKFIVLDYCKKYNLEHSPYFYAQNSEVLFSYLKNKLIKFLMYNPEYVGNHFEIEKTMIHHSQWVHELEPRPKYGAVLVDRKLISLNVENTEKLSAQYPDIKNIYISIKDLISVLSVEQKINLSN